MKRATTIEQNGNYTGQEIGRVFFTKTGFNPNHHQFVGLGDLQKARDLAMRLNAAPSDNDAETLWDQV